jgi:hypothetical protein
MIHRLHNSNTCKSSAVRTRPTAFRRVCLALAAVVLLDACSFFELTYNNLNWIIPWYVDDYIALNHQQENLLDELIKKELRWHRSTQLPLYARWLRELNRDLESGFTDAKVTGHLARFEEFREALMRETATHTATLLATASDSQIDEIFGNFKDYNREFFDAYIGRSPEELQRNRLERMEGHFGDWLGPLTKTQRAAIDHWSRQRGSIAPDVYAYRKQWQERFRAVLIYRKNEERFTKDMQLLFANPHLYSPPAYLAKRKRNVELGKELFLAITKAATPAQRERLRKTLETYARDFEQLSLQS